MINPMKIKKQASPKLQHRGKSPESPSLPSDARFRDPGDWRSETLLRIRTLIKEADPDVVEEIKWRKPSNPAGVPVWSHNGIICTGETYKEYVKLTFAKGAFLKDPSHLFNQEGTVRCAINIRRGETINEKAFKNLVRAAVTFNAARRPRKG